MIKDSKLPTSFQQIFLNKKPKPDQNTRAWFIKPGDLTMIQVVLYKN